MHDDIIAARVERDRVYAKINKFRAEMTSEYHAALFESARRVKRWRKITDVATLLRRLPPARILAVRRPLEKKYKAQHDELEAARKRADAAVRGAFDAAQPCAGSEWRELTRHLYGACVVGGMHRSARDVAEASLSMFRKKFPALQFRRRTVGDYEVVEGKLAMEIDVEIIERILASE